jgi:O-methyltransferase involved in polyketide biosynthesis
MNEKNAFSDVEQTLFIPLLGKAYENKKKFPILTDTKSIEIIENLDFDIKPLLNSGIGNIFFCLRTKIIDNFVEKYIDKNKTNIILHLGCGLDSRCERIPVNNVDWYDIDFPDVINVRRKFYAENKNYHLISSSITKNEWLNTIPKGNYNYIVVSEGVFQYLKENEIKELLISIKNDIGKYTLIIDAINKLSLKLSKNDKSIKNTGVTLYWGIDSPKEITKWGNGIKLIKEQYLSFEGIKGGNILIKILLTIVNKIPKLKGHFRILIFGIE